MAATTIALTGPGGRPVCERCAVADRPLARMRGLLGRRELPRGQGLLLRPASSIHTGFMRFPIDAVFVDRDLRILKIAPRLVPWRAAARRRAHAVLELPAGECDRVGLRAGDRLAARPVDAPAAPAAAAARRVVWPLAALLAAASLLRLGPGPAGLVAALVCAVLVVLSAIDIAERRLPDRIVLPSAALVLAARIASEPQHWALWLAASLGTAAPLLALALAYPRGLGMGDVKLGLLLGAALGAAVLPAFLLGTLAAAAFAAALLLRDGRAALGRPIPLGPFLALGAIAVLLGAVR